MTTFTVCRIAEFQTLQAVNKLIRNGRCPFDEFVSAIEGDANLEPELATLFAIVEDIADGKRHPKYKKLHLPGLKYSAYECKSKHLRLYLFHDKDYGQIIVLGGKKVDQQKDVRRFQKIIKEYSN